MVFMAALASSVVESTATVLPRQQPLLRRQLQHQLEDGRMNLQRQAVADLRQAGMVGRGFGERDAEELPQRKAVAATPGDAPLRADALEVADQQHPKIDARRNSRTADVVVDNKAGRGFSTVRSNSASAKTWFSFR